MRPRSVTNRPALALLAGLIMLTGCSYDHGAASSRRGTGSRPGAARHARDPVGALRHALSGASGTTSFYLSLGDSL